MKPIQTLFNSKDIESLASRSNMRFGKSMADPEFIEITKENSFNIHAKVERSLKHEEHVEISSTPKGLRWKCTCTAKKNYFCEHVTALTLFIINRNALTPSQ